MNFDQQLPCGCTVRGVVRLDEGGSVEVDIRECDHACKGGR